VTDAEQVWFWDLSYTWLPAHLITAAVAPSLTSQQHRSIPDLVVFRLLVNDFGSFNDTHDEEVTTEQYIYFKIYQERVGYGADI